MFHERIYIERRQKLRRDVGTGVILFLGNEESSMNYADNMYHFRQDSTFLYFFGIDRPGLFALIDIEAGKEIVFGEDLTVEESVWVGERERLADEVSRVGINTTMPLSKLKAAIDQVRIGGKPIHFLPPYRPEHLHRLSFLLELDFNTLKARVSVDLIKAVVLQRSVKIAVEIAEIEKAVDTTVDMQLAAIEYARNGMTEAEIAGKLHGLAISAGGNLSFPTILTVNGQILHNHFSSTVLTNGQVVLCDCGAETAMHYAGDLTRTFPVSNSFSTVQGDIYKVVMHALQTTQELLQPGILFRDVHLFACELLVEGLKELGLMKGDTKEAVSEGAHALFFPCGVGHMMGLDTHDMENLGEEFVGYDDNIRKSSQFGLKSLRLGRALERGFVVTVEPGLYFNSGLINLWESEKKHERFINYGKLGPYMSVGGIRLEDDFLITENGYRILGKHLPRDPREIEGLRT